jgi:hypothetical protein
MQGHGMPCPDFLFSKFCFSPFLLCFAGTSNSPTYFALHVILIRLPYAAAEDGNSRGAQPVKQPMSLNSFTVLFSGYIHLVWGIICGANNAQLQTSNC